MALVGKVTRRPARGSDRGGHAAMRYVAERGVTSVHDMGTRWDDMDVLRASAKTGALSTRIHASCRWRSGSACVMAGPGEHGGAGGRGDDWLRSVVLKGFVDGSLGSHTAAFHEPFSDAPNDCGLLRQHARDMRPVDCGADDAGLHVMVHAIGDRANALLLDTFASVRAANGHATAASASSTRSTSRRATSRASRAQRHRQHAAVLRDRRRTVGEKFIGGPHQDDLCVPVAARRRSELSLGSDWFVAPPAPLEGI